MQDLEVVLNSSPLLSPDVLFNTLNAQQKKEGEEGGSLVVPGGVPAAEPSTISSAEPSTISTAEPSGTSTEEPVPLEPSSISPVQSFEVSSRQPSGVSWVDSGSHPVVGRNSVRLEPTSVSDWTKMRNGSNLIQEDKGFSVFPSRQNVSDDSVNETLDRTPVIEKWFGRGNDPGYADITKLNSTIGQLRFNFSQDAKFLVVSPEAGSRLILTCSEVNLGNCSEAGDSLVVNNVGDVRFGRNSFIYCGSRVKVRVVSLRRRISIRIRRDFGVLEEMECKFFARKMRFLEGDENSCGKLGEGRRSASRIIGGKRIVPGLFPYLAQLDMTKSNGVHTTCSGSLISSTWVLTAAHCLRGVEAISVFLGGTDRKEFTGNEMIIQAEKFVLHKNWNSKTLLGDIALVKLSKSIKYTDEISPVCLPDSKLRNENLLGKKGVAVGWGRLSTTERAPRKAYRVPLPFLSDLRCFLSYPRFFRPKVMMCTESSEERAICYGDSGGPLLYLRNQRVYQVGISSYSSSQVCGESFDVFTRLDDSYVDWINKRIQE